MTQLAQPPTTTEHRTYGGGTVKFSKSVTISAHEFVQLSKRAAKSVRRKKALRAAGKYIRQVQADQANMIQERTRLLEANAILRDARRTASSRSDSLKAYADYLEGQRSSSAVAILMAILYGAALGAAVTYGWFV